MWQFGSGAGGLCAAACLILVAATPEAANAKVIPVNVRVDPFAMPTWDCGGGSYPPGALCWGTYPFRLPFNAVTVDANDLLRIRVDFEGPYLLRWEDDGIVSDAYVFGDEFVSITASSSAGETAVGYQGAFSGALSFRGVRGDLLVNDMSWDVPYGAMGGLNISTTWSSLASHKNLTNSAFAFSGFDAEFQAHGVGFNCGLPPGPCLPATVDQLSFGLATGRFSVIRVPEPGTFALLALGLAGLAATRMRKQ